MQTQAQSKSGGQNIAFDKYPDRCPVCLHGIQPVESGVRWLGPNNKLEMVFRCPSQECERHFISRYLLGAGNLFSLVESLPLTIKTSEPDAVIQNISSEFVSVYREAEEAELRNLKLVCGPGYRKALEFLIKDYVIRSNPDKVDYVKTLLLGKCISDFVKNDRVKEVASRAVWLGNDETHYLRKWEEKDLKDLKNLIELTVLWIRMEELTEATIKEMPAGR